ncbi:MAG: FtsX-like permease family protein [Deltaproteobacteria bacterium]|nr:FtsX-like permease family protein [Deltaproteobacteria bacterium]
MVTLIKKAVRDIRGLGWRAATIALFGALGVAVFTGGFMARDSLEHTRDYYYESLRLADLDLYFTAVSPDEMPALPVRGTRHVARFIYQTSLDMAGKDPTSIILIHQKQGSGLAVNDVEVIEGSRLKDGDKEGILIDRSFAKVHNLKVGDTIALRSLGFPVQFTVRGIAITPEYLVPMGSPYELIPIKGSLGIAFATMDRVREIFGYLMYNNLAFIYDKGGAASKESVLKALKGLELNRITVRENQFSYKWLEQDLRGFDIFVPAVVLLFAVVVCVVTVMVFNRLVQGQRREIGVLMALGFARGQILLGFLFTSVTLGVMAGLFGVLLASPNGWLLADSVAYFLEMPPVRYVYPAHFFVEGFFIGVFLAVASSILPLLEIFRFTPQEAIRHTESRRILTSKIDFSTFLRFRSLLLKYSVRNLVRRPGASLATIALVALAIAILTAFYSSTQSWEFYANKALAQEKWDILATFRVPLSKAEAEKIWNRKEISGVRPVVGELGRVQGKGFYRDYLLYSAGNLSKILDVDFTAGGYFTSDEAFEVIFSKVDHLPVKVGDRVKISSDKRSYTFKVVGILNRMTTGIAYIPPKVAAKMLDDRIRGFHAYSSLPPVEIKKLLYQDENVAWVQPKLDIKTAVLDFLAQAIVVTKISLWIAVSMAVLFLLTGITINVRDREGEYATLASLGYSDGFLTSIIMMETMIEGLVGLLVSIPLSYLFARHLNHGMSEAWFKMDLYFGVKELIQVMVAAIGFLPIAALPGIRHIVNMNIPMSVRRKSFG